MEAEDLVIEDGTEHEEGELTIAEALLLVAHEIGRVATALEALAPPRQPKMFPPPRPKAEPS